MVNEDSLANSWKNSEVFKKQLETNLRELSSLDKYPVHWNISLQILKNTHVKNLLDIGCGCGSFFKVCKENLPELNYCGCDYSQEAIDIAKKTWPDGCFFTKNIMDFTRNDVVDYDILYASAIMDVSPNGDQMLEKILSLNVKKVLLSRVKMTNSESYYITYKAYDTIETCAYYHNIKKIISMFSNCNYNYQIFSDHIYLTST